MAPPAALHLRRDGARFVCARGRPGVTATTGLAPGVTPSFVPQALSVGVSIRRPVARVFSLAGARGCGREDDPVPQRRQLARRAALHPSFSGCRRPLTHFADASACG